MCNVMDDRMVAYQAHGAIADAQLKEDQAKKIYALARELNNSVPAYQNAAQQAAVAVLAR